MALITVNSRVTAMAPNYIVIRILPLLLCLQTVRADALWGTDLNRVVLAEDLNPDIIQHSENNHLHRNLGRSNEPRHSLSKYEHTKPNSLPPSERLRNKQYHTFNNVRPDDDIYNWTGGYHMTYQSARVNIPYEGAVVDAPPQRGSPRAHRAKIFMEVIPPKTRKRPAVPPASRHRYRGEIIATIIAPGNSTTKRATSSSRSKSGSELLNDGPRKVVVPKKPCVVCPLERTLIANHKKDKAYFRKPKLLSCQGKRLSTKLYTFRTTYGVKPGELLPAGTHPSIAQIYYRNEPLQMCHLRVNVIVRRCGPLTVPPNMRVNCDASNIWGSKCRFSCSMPGYRLHGNNREITCDDQLEWNGSIPTCIHGTSCDQPPTPPHGVILCRTPNKDDNAVAAIPDQHYGLPEGSVCRIQCKEGFQLSSRRDESVCRKGSWLGNVKNHCRPHWNFH